MKLARLYMRLAKQTGQLKYKVKKYEVLSVTIHTACLTHRYEPNLYILFKGNSVSGELNRNERLNTAEE
jgi:hypothetical protein